VPAAVSDEPRRRVGLLLAIALIVYTADVVSKVVVVATLSGRPPIRLLGGLVQLLVLRNSGAAFSIGTSMTVVFTLIAVGVIVFILRTSRRLRSLPWAITLGLLLGGATGNLTDRLLRAPGMFRGDVVDWIQLPHWPVFNVADSSIVCGGILAVLLAARGYRLDGTRETVIRDGQQPGGGARTRHGGPAGPQRAEHAQSGPERIAGNGPAQRPAGRDGAGPEAAGGARERRPHDKADPGEG